MTDRPVGGRRGLPRRRVVAAVVVGAIVALVAGVVLIAGRDSTAAIDPGSTLSSASAASPKAETQATASMSTRQPTASASPVVDPTAALAALSMLPVSDAPPAAGYLREQFGQAWSDDVSVAGGHNGCDTRNDVLRRDLTDVQLKPGTGDCVVLSGVLTDAYTGQVLAFSRGAATSDDVQIDHLVALSEAWRSGADRLTADERRDLANDPLNLQATVGAVNQEKGDGDAADWLPPNLAYRCVYLERQIEVKSRYHLSVSTAERDAMARTLAGCGSTPAPSSSGIVSTPAAPTSQRPTPPTTGAGSAGTVVATGGYYPNCRQAWAAGVAPLRTGQPGYREDMDGDRDGIACENPP